MLVDSSTIDAASPGARRAAGRAPDNVRFPPATKRHLVSISVNLATGAVVVSSPHRPVVSPQPFAKSWVLCTRGAKKRTLMVYQSYGITIACNKAGCREC